jgi:hypothetical protein
MRRDGGVILMLRPLAILNRCDRLWQTIRRLDRLDPKRCWLCRDATYSGLKPAWQMQKIRNLLAPNSREPETVSPDDPLPYHPSFFIVRPDD